MTPSIRLLGASALLCAATAALAADAPAAAGTAKPASSPGATPAAAKPPAPPTAGGNGGSVATNSSNTAVQVGPKKPKCPDPGSTACPMEKTPAK